MRKYRFFAAFLLSTVLWTFAFGSAKYYLWALWKDSLGITLEYVAGYLAAGGGVAYLLWGYALKRYGVRLSLAVAAVAAVTLFSGLSVAEAPGVAFLSVSIGFFGFLYGLWVVGRSVLAALEIRRTGLPDAAITGAMNVAFIVSVILGSVLWGKFAEILGPSGHFVLIGTLVAAMVASGFFSHPDFAPDPSCRPNELVTGFGHWKTVFSRHWKLLVPTVALWSLSTVASQQVIQTSVALFWKTPSEAAFVLLYSSVGAIVGNALSARLAKVRWPAFHASNASFALSLAAIPFVFEYAKAAGTYAPVIAIAVAIGFCFSIAANLAEGLYFRTIERENEKEFGSSLYGIVLSVALAATMATVGALAAEFDWKTVFFTLAVFSAIMSSPVRSYAGSVGKSPKQ